VTTANVAEHGGHFAALEQPAILVDELRTGLRDLRPDGAVPQGR
jgi:hypothetical protein